MEWTIANNTDRINRLLKQPFIFIKFGNDGFESIRLVSDRNHSSLDKIIRTHHSISCLTGNISFTEFDVYQSAIYWSGGIYFIDEIDYGLYLLSTS